MRTAFHVLSVLLLCAHATVAETVFDDGESHVITAAIEESPVRIANETTVVHRGLIRSASALETVPYRSIVSLSGASTLTVDRGEISAICCETPSTVHATENSKVNLTSGSVHGNGIYLENSEIQISGGTHRIGLDMHTPEIYAGIQAVDSHVAMSDAVFDVSGDVVAHAIRLQDSSATISGGMLSLASENPEGAVDIQNGSLVFSGGQIQAEAFHSGATAVRVGDGSEFMMHGGLLSTVLPLDNSPSTGINASGARVEITGGDIVSNEPSRLTSILAAEGSEVMIHGRDFNYAIFEPIADLSGTLTGTLLDGNEFSWTFQRSPDSTITLVPEPTATTLFAIGLNGLLGFRRKKNADYGLGTRNGCGWCRENR